LKPAFVAQATRVLVDVLLLTGSLVLAFGLRFDWSIPKPMLARMYVVTPYVLGLQYALLAAVRAQRASWRYFSLRDTRPFVLAFALSSATLTIARYAIPYLFAGTVAADYMVVPLSIVLIDTVLAFVSTVGARAVRRAVSENAEQHARASLRPQASGKIVRTLLIGAGQGGVVTAQELRRRPDLGILPVGFIDDDPARKGMTVCGIPVLGDSASLKSIVAQVKPDEALITIANARGRAIRRLRTLCEEVGLTVRIVPGIYEIVGGTVNLASIREVAIEDLLGRPPVRLDEKELMLALSGQCVLVTGAGGSIGSELCRQISRFRPSQLLLVDSSENNLFHIHRELIETATTSLIPLVGNVIDETRMRAIFGQYRPVAVFHAAAYKHVPMMELNPAQALINNTLGTRIVADLANEYGSREFVLVSTDKAVRPSSIMGASKRAAEIYVQALGARSDTRFITVRFGNVLGSAGSVIPIFKEQIARGGPITVTDERMTRYFMTIPEACQLIMQAGRLGQGGEIFMLDMGEPVRIVDLARDLISLSGLTPDVDIDIVFSGIRPGEKLAEELWSANEGVTATRHPSIFVGNSQARSLQDIASWFQRLHAMRIRTDADWVRPALSELIPELALGTAAPSSPAPAGEPQLAEFNRSFALN
jgi:FlaA1/EpsC-like NDP-sugar epimerase